MLATEKFCTFVGGAVSPLLANIVLNKLDWFLHSKGLHGYGNTIGVHAQCRLALFADTLTMPYYSGPEPYRPGASSRATEDELEADFFVREKRRRGSADTKWQALIRDGFYCRGCGVSVTARTSHADHIEPVHGFASFQQAHSLDNVQTLCCRCHRRKTGAKA